MSRRKAGRVPRRVDPEPDDDDMETPDLVIDVQPEHDAAAVALGPWSPKDLSMRGLLGAERRLDTAPLPLGAHSTCAPRMPLTSNPSGESPALAPARIGTFGWVLLCPGTRPAWRAQPSPPRTPGPSLAGVSLPRDPPGVPSCSSYVHRDPRVGASPLGMAPGPARPHQLLPLTSGFPLSTSEPSPGAGPHPTAHHSLPPCRPPALDQQAPRSVDLRALLTDLPIRGHCRIHGSQKTGLSAPQRLQPHFR